MCIMCMCMYIYILYIYIYAVLYTMLYTAKFSSTVFDSRIQLYAEIELCPIQF